MAAKKKNKSTNAKKNTIIKTVTFGKKKVKVGKIVKKANVTDTRFKTTKVVLMEQLKPNVETEAISHRGLTLNDLCRRMNHYSEIVIRDCIIEMKQLLSTNVAIATNNLRMIVPCVGRVISAGLKNESTKNQLKALLRLIFKVPSDAFSSHFSLFVTHVLTALTDIRLPAKLFAFDVLLMLMRQFPDLCAQRLEIFDRYLEIMSSDRRPTNEAIISDSVLLFLNVFEKPKKNSLWADQRKVDLSIAKQRCTLIKPILPLRNAIYFPVIYTKPADSEQNSERLNKLHAIVAEIKFRESRIKAGSKT